MGGGLRTASGHIRTVAGDGTLGFSGDGGSGTSAQVSIPKGMVTRTGILWPSAIPKTIACEWSISACRQRAMLEWNWSPGRLPVWGSWQL